MGEKKIQEELSEICRIIIATVDTDLIYLFGSRAYGTPTKDSDYDLCVIIPDNSLRPVDAIKQIRKSLFELQSTSLDIIVYRKSDFQRKQETQSLEKKITDDGILLFRCGS